MSLRNRIEPLPHKAQTKIVKERFYTPKHFVQVSLSPALITAIADETTVTGAWRYKA